MIVSRQLYENSTDKLFSLHLNGNIEDMTLKYEQQYLCRHHREKYRRHQYEKLQRTKLKTKYYEK